MRKEMTGIIEVAAFRIDGGQLTKDDAHKEIAQYRRFVFRVKFQQ